MNTIRKLAGKRALTLVAVALTVGVLAFPAGTMAASQRVVNGHCTGRSASVLTVAHENGRINIEFEVDQNVIGKTWRVGLSDNRQRVFSGYAKTAAPDGSLTVDMLTRDRPGLDLIRATAHNPVTGETCTASASI